jgi:iron complex transport system ATP-binding protein
LVIFAQARHFECDVLMLDKPCFALDCRNEAIVIGALKRLRVEHGTSIVFTTHSPRHALESQRMLPMFGRQALRSVP